ncbi:glycosyltransferase 87 family protein [Rhodococcus sp. AG1013]|uniref:glycosyltransferase 87 family protein n=1 Tax=Rhodococcus sp. AG1013 TaxID=2183996 RepID=UPI000E0B587B|nr:glycosyltransferase 87 family protein [Rhodococcus sp. AG1013]
MWPEAGELPRRRGHLAVLVLWAIASVVLVFTTVRPWMPTIGIFAGGADLDVYRDGARHVMEDLPLYTEPVIHGLLYTYTPFSTLMFIPFGLLPGGIDKYIWMGANLVLLVAIVALCWRMLGYRITPYLVGVSALLAVACTFLEPVRTTLFYGQINLVLMALVLWDVSRGENSKLKGVGVGIAAGIKLTPAYFVLYYLVLRQWRAAAVAVGTIAATIGVSWLVLPNDSWQYWTKTFFESTRIAQDEHPSNQSLRGVIAHLTGKPAPTVLWVVLAAIVVVVSMWIVLRLHRGGEHLLAVTVAGLSAAAVSPFSWSHHWVWFVPLLVYIVHRALTNWWWWLAALVIAVATGAWPYRWDEYVVVVGLFLFPPWWTVADVLMNIYILLYVGVLIGAGIVAARCTPDGVHDHVPAADANRT